MRVNVQQQDLILSEKIEEPNFFFFFKLCIKVNTRSCYCRRKESVIIELSSQKERPLIKMIDYITKL